MWSSVSTMSEIVRPLLGLSLVVLLGTIVDRVFRLLPARSIARWPMRGVVGLSVLYLASALPTYGLALGLLAAWFRSRRAAPALPVTRPRPLDRRDTTLGFVTVAIVVALVVLRPPVPIYWDEFVWMAKARIESNHPFGLVDEVLRANTSAIPLGYPPLEPLSVAALSGWDARTTSLGFGAELLEILVASAFALLAIERTPRKNRPVLAFGAALLCAPLVFIHLRSSYVDLETGLLAGVLLLLLEGRRVVPAVVVSIVLVGLKDEGTVHVAAITSATFAVALVRRRWRGALRSVIVAASGLVPFVLWHVKLRTAGIVRTDHALGNLAFERLPNLARWTFLHMMELLAWGPLWGMVLGLFVAIAIRPRAIPRTARLRALVLVSQIVVFALGLLSTSDRVMEFAHNGTLLGRLLVELTPVATLTITAAL